MVKEAAFVTIQRVIMTMKENVFSATIQMHSKMKNVKRVPTQKKLKIVSDSLRVRFPDTYTQEPPDVRKVQQLHY